MLPHRLRRTWHGPDWFAGHETPDQIELHPLPDELDVAGSVSIFTENGRVLARRNSRKIQVLRGGLGGQLVFDLGDNLEVTFLIHHAEATLGELTVTSDVTGLPGASAKKVLRFLDQLARAGSIGFSVGESSSTAIVDATSLAPDPFELELADDLAFIEEELGVPMPFPHTIGKVVDRIWVRVVRRILEGKVSLAPGIGGLNLVLTGKADGAVMQMLELGGAIGPAMDEGNFRLFKENISLDDVSLLLPSAVAEDASGHISALRDGQGEGRKVHLVPSDGVAGVLIWSPSRIDGLETLAPTPWGLTGISEHRQLRQALDGTDHVAAG